MSSKWFTAVELAGIPELPKTKRGVNKAASRDGWKSRKRDTGQGNEYHISSLPEEARVALHLKAIGAPIPRHRANPRINATRVRSAAKTMQALCRAQRKQIDHMEALAGALLAALDDSGNAGDQS